MKIPIMAAHRGTGMGTGKINTLNLGLITASAPPKANTAPDAPTATAEGDAKSVNKALPAMPPSKYTIRKGLVPINLNNCLPKKYRVIILAMMCQKPRWINKLVAIVQGRDRKPIGWKPKR